jgi:hypothetical protein
MSSRRPDEHQALPLTPVGGLKMVVPHSSHDLLSCCPTFSPSIRSALTARNSPLLFVLFHLDEVLPC